ncbi:hypothetical protein LG324_19500 [Phycicoccus jejuensis]|uniref:hypothetical protein n=1 Tax=Phycicoccus TaxID=367298 RepID=UPI0004C472DC|nr:MULTISPECIES: hypothetical protein [Phycicoccus]GIL35079.1 hypothetical protein PDTK01_11550 [Phycicoccus sp. DTK01]
MAVSWKALAHVVRIPPQAWDAIVPHGPAWSVVGRFDEVELNPQPLPPREAAIGARMLESLLWTSIIIVGGRDGGGRALLDEIDDWCGTGWPKKWPKPKPRHDWDEGQLFTGAALAAAALAEQYDHDPEMQDVLGAAAERLLERAG